MSERARPVAIAHRGGSLEEPENTMRAFAHAVALGYEEVELDVRTTLDGGVVVFHDATLDRVAGRPGAIAELPSADVQTARVHGTEPIPLLDEVLAAWPALRLTVELKDDASVRHVARILEDRHAWDRVWVGSFSDARLARVRELSGGRARTSLGEREILICRVASFGLPWRPRGDVAQIPVRRRRVTLVDRRALAWYHARGIGVQVWTVNDEAEMGSLLELGVDGLMTDRPAILKELLIRRGEWPTTSWSSSA